MAGHEVTDVSAAGDDDQKQQDEAVLLELAQVECRPWVDETQQRVPPVERRESAGS